MQGGQNTIIKLIETPKCANLSPLRPYEGHYHNGLRSLDHSGRYFYDLRLGHSNKRIKVAEPESSLNHLVSLLVGLSSRDCEPGWPGVTVRGKVMQHAQDWSR